MKVWCFIVHISLLSHVLSKKCPSPAKLIQLNPGADLSFWDIQYSQDLYINRNDKVRFNTAWGVHNLFIARSTSATDEAASTCDTQTINSNVDWQGAFCACNSSGAFACHVVETSNAANGNFVAPRCDDPSLGFLPMNLPGIGDVFIGAYDHQFTESGVFWAICTPGHGSHCKAGMKLKIQVKDSESDSPVTHSIAPSAASDRLAQWGFYSYRTIHAKKNDRIRFRFFENFHGIITSPVTQNGTDFPEDIPGRTQRCNQEGFKHWAGVPDAPEVEVEGEYKWTTYDLSINEVMGIRESGSFDVVCSAAGPSHLPSANDSSFGHGHCVVGGQGFRVVVDGS